MMWRLSAVVIVACALWPCLGLAHQAQQKEQKPAEEAKPAEPAKSPIEAGVENLAAPVDPDTYIIGPEDILHIRVWHEPELSGPVAVRPDGKITLPLIHDVGAAGQSPKQLTASLTEHLKKFINRPEVLVVVIQVRSKKFMISGEVGRPGSYPLVVPTTVLEAIVNAGGLKEFANRKKIVIMRGDKRLFFNYKDVIRGKNTSQNILLEHKDHVIVE